MLKSTIQQDLISALKTHDKTKVEILRYLMALVKDEEINRKKPLEDKEVIIVLNSYLKKLKESLLAFQKAKRQDLIEKTQKEIEIVSHYLPEQLSDEELEKEIRKILEENKNIANIGAITGLCVKKLAGKADGRRVAAAVKRLF